MKREIYIPPAVDIIEVKVEKGFAASDSNPNFTIDEWGNQSF